MSLGLLNAAMLAGLAGVAIPVIIHFLHRRHDPVIDWGAMQFLDLGRQARRRVRIEELLLMLARMALLALVALALARPFLGPSTAGAEAAVGSGGARRDVVLIIDGSDSMGRQAGGTTPRAQAVRWARDFVKKLQPGDSVAVLDARDRVRPIIAPASFDLKKVDAALAAPDGASGGSDLPSAVVEALRLLEATENPAREVILLSDGQRHAWRPGETRRWELVRELHRRLPVRPRIWAANFVPAASDEVGPNGSLGPLVVSRAVLTPNLPVTVTTTLTNQGKAPLIRAVELLMDGKSVPGSGQVVGPVPPGGQVPLTFKTSVVEPGSHLIQVKLAQGGDSWPGDDEAFHPVRVVEALAVLLVDGEPGAEPLTSETDFLRAALAPAGDDTPQVRAKVVTLDAFSPRSLEGQRLVVLANVERLEPAQVAALGRFVESGGGLLIAPGDRVDHDDYNERLGTSGVNWLPAQLRGRKGQADRREAIAHPAPRTFTGPVMAPFAAGESPALGSADLFAYQVLEPLPGAAVTARLDTTEPWVVERALGRGRVLLLAGALDAEAGTLPVNPDFVPLVHEWTAHLATAADAPRPVAPGEPLIFDLQPIPPPEVETLELFGPIRGPVRVPVVREGGRATARFDDTSTPGVYRAGSEYGLVARDPRESDPAPLDPAEAAQLSKGWPFSFEPDPAHLTTDLLATGPARREVWRGLMLAALGGLCVEVWMTRRLVRGRGAD